MTGGNPGQVNSGPILAVLARSPASLDRVVASLVVTGIFALAMIVAAGRAAVVLPARARIPLHVGSVERCVEVPHHLAKLLLHRILHE